MVDLEMTSQETKKEDAKAAAPAAPGSIDDQLRKLKQALDQKESSLNVQSKQRDALKTDFTALEKSAGEVKKSPDDYELGRSGLIQDKTALEDYYTPKYGMVTGTLGAKVKIINEKIIEVENKIIAINNALPKKKKEVKTTGEAYEEATEQLAVKQKKFDDLKNLLKGSQDDIKKMQGWRKTIEEFDDKNDPKSMFVYMRELKSLLDATRVRAKEEYKSELEQAWTDLNDAKDSARVAQQKWDEAKNALAQANADLKSLEESRVKDNLEKIKNV